MWSRCITFFWHAKNCILVFTICFRSSKTASYYFASLSDFASSLHSLDNKNFDEELLKSIALQIVKLATLVKVKMNEEVESLFHISLKLMSKNILSHSEQAKERFMEVYLWSVISTMVSKESHLSVWLFLWILKFLVVLS